MPRPNVDADTACRRDVVPVLVGRELRGAAGLLRCAGPTPNARARPGDRAVARRWYVLVVNLTDAEKDALRDLSASVRERFGARLRELALFGSRARGEGHPLSDLDVVIVVDDLTGAEAREVAYGCGDLLTRYDAVGRDDGKSVACIRDARASREISLIRRRLTYLPASPFRSTTGFPSAQSVP